MHHTSIPWQDPIATARFIDQHYDTFTFLYSAMDVGFTGRYSLLAWDVRDHISGTDWSLLESKLSHTDSLFDNAWFGYIGYELKNTLETLPTDPPSWITPPPLMATQYHTILLWDHRIRTCRMYSTHTHTSIPSQIPSPPLQPPIDVCIRSNMSKTDYLTHVQSILDAIFRGDLYQANLTRKFGGDLPPAYRHFDLFVQLCEYSPAPYSAFLKWPTLSIASSSPEQFLHITSDGIIESRPIKGSLPRSQNPANHAQEQQQLHTSIKDRRENLMIVDLMRHDISKSSGPGSVHVPRLYTTTQYETIHHMSSTICGTKHPDISTLDVIKGCFPPGSMTGAPKVQAMTLCSQLEQINRGIYAGGLGWWGGDGSAHLSVVIRTLIMQQAQYEFQVGGAIIAQSNPELEWQETLSKAAGIARTLGLRPHQDMCF